MVLPGSGTSLVDDFIKNVVQIICGFKNFFYIGLLIFKCVFVFQAVLPIGIGTCIGYVYSVNIIQFIKRVGEKRICFRVTELILAPAVKKHDGNIHAL